MAEPITVHIEDEDDSVTVDPVTGDVTARQPDGNVVVSFGAAKKDAASGKDFDTNLAEDMDQMLLSRIANELSEAIGADDRSREGYLAVKSRGLDLMGLKLEAPRATVGDSSSAVEGMSSVTNPLLLDAILRGWANAQAELLPASGPVKIKDDGDETLADDDLSESLERDMNHYLTTTASEYYPDTSHMLLWGVYFGGSGFKKIYRCPMRRRPVAESVDAKDLIVSDTTKDLRSCARITHQILMRPSVMRRMKFLKAYRNVALTQPTAAPNAVDAKIAGIQGTSPQPERPEDQPYTIWETQCELDLDEFAPTQFKGKGLSLPYLVTIDKDTKEILALRRDWDEDDKECERQRMYVKYPYVPGPGFYGTGMLNILGNSSAAMTAAWREALDAGMFASFPGGLISKIAGRQNSSNFRVGPGEFASVETGNQRIQDVAMAMPYRDPTSGLITMMQMITEQSQKLAGAPDIPTGEGVQNVPVGTMLAQIEQATKVMAAAHKGMHVAQSEELELIEDLFRKNPDDFWRLNKVCPRDFWNEQKFIQALDNCKMVPVSDPNIPSHMHRVMKAVALFQLSQSPILGPHMDAGEVLTRILVAIKEDPTGLVVAPPAAPQGPDPAAIMAQAKLMGAQAQQQTAQAKLAQVPQDANLEAAKLQTQRDIAASDLQKEQIIHQGDMAVAQHDASLQDKQHQLNVVKTAADIANQNKQHGLDQAQAGHQAGMDVAEHALNVHQALNPPTPGIGE